MPFAVQFQVTLPQSTREEDERMLEEAIVPAAKAQPGFVRGVWMRKTSDPSYGVGVVVFESEQQAKDAADALRPPPGGPAVQSVDIYEVGTLA